MTTRIDRRSFLGTAGLGAVAAMRAEASRLDDDPLGVRAEFPVTREQASVALFNNRSDVERLLGVLRAMA